MITAIILYKIELLWPDYHTVGAPLTIFRLADDHHGVDYSIEKKVVIMWLCVSVVDNNSGGCAKAWFYGPFKGISPLDDEEGGVDDSAVSPSNVQRYSVIELIHHDSG